MAKKQNSKAWADIGKPMDIDINLLENNEGQIAGCPKNPRYIKGDEYDKLKKSLTDAPELLQYKPLMVYAIDGGKYVVVCGNMRLRVCRELQNNGIAGFEQLPCFVLNADVPIQKIKEYAIKDNVQAGNWDWDDLANDWDVGELTDWGVDCSFLSVDDEEGTDVDALFENAQTTEEKPKEIKLTVHIPNELQESVENIKEAIKSVVAEYEGIEIK